MTWLEKTPLLVRLVLALGWFCIIFLITETPEASSEHTLHIVQEAGGEEWLNGVFRVCAHLFMFGVQGLLVYFLLNPNLFYDKKKLLLSLFVVVLLATLDEFHQSMMPGRFPRLVDVFTDLVGAVVCILLTIKLRERIFV
jgi:VanZ family protein